MTKQELLDSLTSKFYRVGTETLQNEIDGIQYYLVMVHDRDGDTMRNQNVGFFVENEGQANETAYWNGIEPKSTPVPTTGFLVDLHQYITDKITDGTIEAGYIEDRDVSNETAIVRVVMPTTLDEQRVFIDRDNGNLRHRLL